MWWHRRQKFQETDYWESSKMEESGELGRGTQPFGVLRWEEKYER